MPNWCFTRVTFHGNETEIRDFHEKITEYTSKSLIENGFGSRWLGNVLAGVGLGDRIDNSDKTLRLRCKGSIEYIDDIYTNPESEDASFWIDTETAWGPMVNMWVEVIKALKYESIGFSFIAEEPSLALYEIYDPYGDYEDRYCVDMRIEGADADNSNLNIFFDWSYYDRDQEDYLIKNLQRLLNTDEADLNVLIDKAEHYDFKDESSYIHIYEYTRLENLNNCM